MELWITEKYSEIISAHSPKEKRPAQRLTSTEGMFWGQEVLDHIKSKTRFTLWQGERQDIYPSRSHAGETKP